MIEQPRKKLIEVALPLDEINAACKADKDRKTGTIRNLHKWFAPMPMPALRALLFASLVDDPQEDEKRAYLLDVIKRLVVSGADAPCEAVLSEAKGIIASGYPEGTPVVADPFCGGGSTLVEAQRLGLETFGSDLNPVPALIARALTEVLPAVHNGQPLHPQGASAEGEGLFTIAKKPFAGYDGLIQDLLYYAKRIRDEARVELGAYLLSRPGEQTLYWAWARQITCPNPACGQATALATSFWLSKQKGGRAWIEPRLNADGLLDLRVITGQAEGQAPAAPKTGRGGNFECLVCRGLIEEKYVMSEGQAGRMDLRMMAVCILVDGKKCYREPTSEDRRAAAEVPRIDDFPRVVLPDIPRWFSGPRFGIQTQEDLYTPRQLLVLDTLARLVRRSYQDVLDDGGTELWAQAVTTLLGLVLGKAAAYGSSQARIQQGAGGSNRAVPAFGRHDVPMTWDFPEINLLSDDSANWMQVTATVCRAVVQAPSGAGTVVRADARSAPLPIPSFIATDPPYFDAIGYADLSDYVYVWHRRALRERFPDLYGTAATPKIGELTAIPSHHGGKDEARDYFIAGFTDAFLRLKNNSASDLPLLVVYASKEQDGGREEETRWSSILTAMIAADLEITGTWPIHGAKGSRMIGIGTNAVASYVVMVCRPRSAAAMRTSLADFNRALRRELRPAIQGFQAAGVLPVDLAQAAMGPGMQVYSRYKAVLDQAGSPIPVEQALRLINASLSEVLDEQQGDLDAYSRFAVGWWEANGWNEAPFGDADKAARPQGLSVDDLVRAEVAKYPRPGFVKVLGDGDLDRTWSPENDSRPSAWEAVHHLTDRLIDGGGAVEAGRLMAGLGTYRDSAQALVYRLHDIAAKKNRFQDQERYNALIGSWSDLLAISATEKEGLF